MPERQRAYFNGKLVTILKGKPGKRGKAEIRNHYGLKQTVDAKELQAIDPREPESRLRYERDVG